MVAEQQAGATEKHKRTEQERGVQVLIQLCSLVLQRTVSAPLSSGVKPARAMRRSARVAQLDWQAGRIHGAQCAFRKAAVKGRGPLCPERRNEPCLGLNLVCREAGDAQCGGRRSAWTNSNCGRTTGFGQNYDICRGLEKSEHYVRQ